MSQPLHVITEASDLYFHFTRTAIFTFINKNPQFTGKIQLMVHPDLPLSQGNFETLKLLYSSIEKIQVDSIFSNLKTSLPGRLDKIYSSLKLNVFTLATQNTIYFSSISISINSILPILKDKSICRSLDWSVIYIASSREDLVDISKNLLLVESPTISDALSQILPDVQVFANTEIVLASTATDQKFTQLGHTLNNSRIIVYDNITRSSPNYSKINRVWLEKNKISGTTVAKLSIPVKLVQSRTVKVDRTLHKKNIQAYPQNNKIINNSQIILDKKESATFFKNKTICLVANSSELLNYNYGEFIDSHDIVIRFNGYSTIPEKTGNKIDVHCVFREYYEKSNTIPKFKIVISPNRKLWDNSILKFHSNDAIINNYKIINFNYPSKADMIYAKCNNIQFPTSGLCVYVYLSSLGIASNIRLVGFNGYNGGDHLSILRKNSDSGLAKIHNYTMESNYWNSNFIQLFPGVLKCM